MNVRAATPADAEGVLAIYAPFVRGTSVSFELEPPTLEEMAGRIQAAHLWLVAEDAPGDVTGYAYGGAFRTRPAYRWTVEVSAYVRESLRGRGTGRALYTALLDQLAARGFVTAVAGITLPNPSSVGFHEALGFQPVGVYRNVGFKMDRWWDVGWWQRPLRDTPERPEEPRRG